MKTKQWNKILKDLGWDSPSYGWTKEKSILKRAMKYEKEETVEQIMELECMNSIKEVLEMVYKNGVIDGEQGTEHFSKETVLEEGLRKIKEQLKVLMEDKQ